MYGLHIQGSASTLLAGSAPLLYLRLTDASARSRADKRIITLLPFSSLPFDIFSVINNEVLRRLMRFVETESVCTVSIYLDSVAADEVPEMAIDSDA